MFDGASWVDVGISGISSLLNLGAPVFIGANAPTHPLPGALWWNGTVLKLWDGVAWNLIGPTAGTVSPTVALQGAVSGLRIVATGAGVTATARQVVLFDGTNFSTVFNFNAGANVGGVGAGGIDQGGLVSSAWYAVWAINGPTVSLMLSQSSTAPVMPPGYAAKAMLGWVRSTSGGVVSTLQVGREVQYTGIPLPQIASGVAGSAGSDGQGPVVWTPFSIGAFAPPTASFMRLSIGASGTDSALTQVAPNNSYGDWATATASPFIAVYATTGGGAGPPVYGDMVLESGNIYYQANRVESFCQCIGWGDGL